MNKKETTTTLERIGKLLTTASWWLMGIFAVLLVATLAGTEVMGTQAATPGGAFGTFNAQICVIVNYIGTIIGTLATLTIVIAGIMYSLSQGNSKGGLSIDTAKNMIVSALSGVALYILGSFLLLNPCGAPGAAILNRIFGS